MNSGVIRVVLFAAVLLCPFSVFAEVYKTGDTGADCTGCGSWWPWNSTCEWDDPETASAGMYREFAGDKGSTACHSGAETPLPYIEEVTFTMGERNTYLLKSGSWTWFGLDFTYSYMTTEATSVKQKNACHESGCCLEPLKGFARWNYEQMVRKRRIATLWYYCPGTAAWCYKGFEDCVACDATTREFGVLCKLPSPELLPAEQAGKMPFPYDPALHSIASYCGD